MVDLVPKGLDHDRIALRGKRVPLVEAWGRVSAAAFAIGSCSFFEGVRLCGKDIGEVFVGIFNEAIDRVRALSLALCGFLGVVDFECIFLGCDGSRLVDLVLLFCRVFASLLASLARWALVVELAGRLVLYWDDWRFVGLWNGSGRLF